MSDDFATDLLTGLAELLATAGVGHWSPTGVVTATDLPTIALRQTPDRPDQVITLSDYTAVASPRLSDSETAVNFRIRGTRSPNACSSIAEKIWRALHALGRTTLGTAPDEVMVGDVQYRSAVQVGPDANGRHVRSVNYVVLHNRPHPRLD
jgi:hypothetical protein